MRERWGVRRGSRSVGATRRPPLAMPKSFASSTLSARLPENSSEFSIFDPANLSLRLVACSSLSELRWKAGDAEGGKQLAREMLDICNRAQGVKELDKWAKWAHEFIRTEGPLN